MKLILFSVSIFIFCCAASCERDSLPPDEENLYIEMDIDGMRWEAQEHPNGGMFRKKISSTAVSDSNGVQTGVVFYGEAYWPNTTTIHSAVELEIQGFSVNDTISLYPEGDSITSTVFFVQYDQNQVPIEAYFSTENEDNWIYYSMIDWSKGYAEGSFQSEVYNQNSDTLLITLGRFRGNFNF